MKQNTKLLVACVCLFASVLVVDARKNDIWKDADEVLLSYIARGDSFPGAVAVVGDRNGTLYSRAFGSFTYGENTELGENQPMTIDTEFDMASCTKVLITTTMAAQFYQRGELDLDMRVCDEYLLGDAFANNGKEAITIRHLLLHNSGFPPDPAPNYWDPEFGCAETFEDFPPEDFGCNARIHKGLMAQTLAHAVGEKYVYSDLSMITMMYVLGGLARRLGYVTEADLRPTCTTDSQDVCYYEAYARKYVMEALSLKNSNFGLTPERFATAAPAWNDTVYQHRLIQGTVSDGNAYALGGIAGHAGLFSTAPDVSAIVRAWLFPEEGSAFLNASTVDTFIQVADVAQSSRALGWDTNAHEYTHRTCGDLSASTFTHTGFTGTMVCMDPEQELYVVLLTNRVYPRGGTVNSQQIYDARVAFTNAINGIYSAHFSS